MPAHNIYSSLQGALSHSVDPCIHTRTLLVTFSPILGTLVGKLCSAFDLYVGTVRMEAHRHVRPQQNTFTPKTHLSALRCLPRGDIRGSLSTVTEQEGRPGSRSQDRDWFTRSETYEALALNRYPDTWASAREDPSKPLQRHNSLRLSAGRVRHASPPGVHFLYAEGW